VASTRAETTDARMRCGYRVMRTMLVHPLSVCLSVMAEVVTRYSPPDGQPVWG
jgi:hypothetical protein